MTTFEARLRDAIHKALASDPDGRHRFVSTWQVDAVLAAVLAEPPRSATGRCESVCDLSPDGSDPHFCAFMEHATGRHQCDLCGSKHTWGPMKPAFPNAAAQMSGFTLDIRARESGDVFDRIEIAAVEYRYRNRIPHGVPLNVVVKGGMGALMRAAGERSGVPVISEQAIVGWLGARGLALMEVGTLAGFTDDGREILIFRPGTWVTEPDPKTNLDERPHSRACGIAIHNHGPACAPDCPTCAEGAKT